MTKKIIGIILMTIGISFFLFQLYNFIQIVNMKVDSINESEFYKTVDGKIIKDEINRKEHNKHVFEMQRLDVELNKTKGKISKYDAALLLDSIDYKEKIAEINEKTNMKLLNLNVEKRDLYLINAIFMLVGIIFIYIGYITFKSGKKSLA